MKQVLEQYGAALIAVLVALMLFRTIGGSGFFKGKGISEVLGMMVQYSIGDKSMVDQGALEELAQHSILEIEEKNVYFTVSQSRNISECFVAKNKQGQELSLCVKQVWDRNWVEVNTMNWKSGQDIQFSETGIFWMEICAQDANQKEHSWIVKVLVNER